MFGRNEKKEYLKAMHKAVDALVHALLHDKDDEVRYEAANRLGEFLKLTPEKTKELIKKLTLEKTT